MDLPAQCSFNQPVSPKGAEPPKNADSVPVTRLAPSPTGALHLGNARTFIVNWAMARSAGWRVRMRIENLDTPRIKAGAAEATLDTLAWLGLDWDGPSRVQSDDLEPYRDAMRSLAARGRVYPCRLTRREIEAAASAPHADTDEAPFPRALRPAARPAVFDDVATNWRLVVEPGAVRFDDRFAGPQSLDPAHAVGDFVVWTKRAQPAYQLAVVIDDAAGRVDRIVRGDDLLDSTARQLTLYRVLDLGPEPSYWHLPLVRGPDGRRLAKRHGDTRIDRYRASGVAPERIVGLCAHWCGMTDERVPMPAREFQRRLDPGTIPKGDVTFTGEDDRWLLDGC